jgi:KTSC domain
MRAIPPALLLLLCPAHLLIANSPDENTRSEARSPVISHIPRARVGSNAIASIGYSKRRHILEIEFANGAVYRYLEVAPSVYRDLIAAESKARYYDANIKGNYRSVRVRPRATQHTN